jgi:putative Holliday junction resolvase
LKILAVDHGEKRIGVAVSDSTATIASPLTVIAHTSRIVDAAQVVALAAEHQAVLILVGQSFDEEGQPNAAGRSAARFAQALRLQTSIPVEMWDETLSSQDAQANRITLGVPRKKRAGHLDALAAAVILQSYLEANRES